MRLPAAEIAPDLWDHLNDSYDTDNVFWWAQGRMLKAVHRASWTVGRDNPTHKMGVMLTQPASRLSKLILPPSIIASPNHYYRATETTPASHSHFSLRIREGDPMVDLTGRYLEANSPEDEMPMEKEWRIIATDEHNPAEFVSRLQQILTQLNVISRSDA